MENIRDEFIKALNENCVEFSSNERGGYIDDTFKSVLDCVVTVINNMENKNYKSTFKGVTINCDNESMSPKEDLKALEKCGGMKVSVFKSVQDAIVAHQAKSKQ